MTAQWSMLWGLEPQLTLTPGPSSFHVPRVGSWLSAPQSLTPSLPAPHDYCCPLLELATRLDWWGGSWKVT